MSLEIALPYTTTNSDDLRYDVPGYDRDATELLLMALVNDKRKKYFCKSDCVILIWLTKDLHACRRKASSTPTFEEDYQREIGQLRLFVLIVYLSTYRLMNYRIMASVSVRHLRLRMPNLLPQLMRLINQGADHEIAFGKAWVRTDSGPNKHDDYLSMASGASPTYDGSVAVMLIGIRNWLSDRPFPNGRDVYGDTIVLLKYDGTTKEVYTYPAALRPGISRVYTDLRGDAIVAPGLLSFDVNTARLYNYSKW